MKQKPLIVALDVDTLEQAKALVDVLADSVDIFKIGSQLFTACGPEAVRYVYKKGAKVFLDLKFHDIPNTVAGAVKSAASLNVFMLTVHAQGGKEMLEAAARVSPRPLIVGVTVLTSQSAGADTAALVLERARLAQSAGLDGVVASPEEAQMLRKNLGKDFIIVTPGIRPAGTDAGDQKRIATPAAAIKSGSTYLVVGRPIVADKSPRDAALRILEELRGHPP